MRVHLLTTALHRRFGVEGVEDVAEVEDREALSLIAMEIAREPEPEPEPEPEAGAKPEPKKRK